MRLDRTTRWTTFGLLLGGILVSSGCVTREDIRGIQTDLYSIQQGIETKLGTVEDQTNTVQNTQSDLRLDMRELSDNIAALNAELQDNRGRVAELATRLDDLEASLKSRMDAQIELLSGSKFVDKPLPSTVFNLANADYIRGRYPDAISGFHKYIKQFPKGERVPEAKLNIADINFKQKQWSKAALAYDELINEFPEHRLAPTAMLKKGMSFEALGKRSISKKIFKGLVTKYPHRSEARKAQEMLNSWTAETSQ